MCCVIIIKLQFNPLTTFHSSFFNPAGMGSDSWPSFTRITADRVQLVDDCSVENSNIQPTCCIDILFMEKNKLPVQTILIHHAALYNAVLHCACSCALYVRFMLTVKP